MLSLTGVVKYAEDMGIDQTAAEAPRLPAKEQAIRAGC